MPEINKTELQEYKKTLKEIDQKFNKLIKEYLLDCTKSAHIEIEMQPVSSYLENLIKDMFLNKGYSIEFVNESRSNKYHVKVLL
jgi:hypothetical protein